MMNMVENNKDKGRKESSLSVEQRKSTTTQSLHTVAKGGIIVFVGTIAGMVLGFVGRVLFARFFEASEYGIFSLGFTIAFISASIGTIGLREGATRQIAYYRGKKENEKVRTIVLWTIIFSSVAGIAFMLLIFISSDFVASNVFDIPGLSFPLKLFSVSIPFYIFIYIFVSIFRGFKKVKEKVIFEELIKNLLFPVLLCGVIILGLSYTWGVFVYTLSIELTGIGLLLYFMRKRIVPSLGQISLRESWSTGKDLLLFSLPLMLVSILHNVLGWTDTLMLGYFLNADVVGLYNAATPLGKFVSVALGMMTFVYFPLAAELFATGQEKEIKKSYSILTKWVCTATLPLTLVLVFFPGIVINFFFGANYVLAKRVLQILAIGFFINNLLGPNRELLTVMKKTSFLMQTTFLAAVINIGLNALFISEYGIEGAAVATVTAVIFINIVRTIKLYSLAKIHSLKKNIIKPIILSVVIILVLYRLIAYTITVDYWMLPVIFFVFLGLYGVSLLVTRSFDTEDIDLLLKIEKKMHLDFGRTKRVLKRFI